MGNNERFLSKKGQKWCGLALGWSDGEPIKGVGEKDAPELLRELEELGIAPWQTKDSGQDSQDDE